MPDEIESRRTNYSGNIEISKTNHRVSTKGKVIQKTSAERCSLLIERPPRDGLKSSACDLAR